MSEVPAPRPARAVSSISTFRAGFEKVCCSRVKAGSIPANFSAKTAMIASMSAMSEQLTVTLWAALTMARVADLRGDGGRLFAQRGSEDLALFEPA